MSTNITKLNTVVGAGGGGGKRRGESRSPIESPNTLFSESELNVLFLLGEGEIEGPANGNLYQCVYLDDAPIQNPDGSFNYFGVRLAFRSGTLTQTPISGFSSQEIETPVGVQVKQKTGTVTRTLSNPEVNAVRVRLLVPALQRVDEEKGDILPTDVAFNIEVSTDNGPYIERVRDVISGKTTSPFEKQYRIELSKASVWAIRVNRLTADSESNKLANDLFWQSFTEIIDAKLRYPSSALLGMRIPAEQFRSLPRVSFLGKFKKILIPSNYNPVARTYTGIWDGTFAYGYSNNPAWVFYDLIINDRYGCGQYIAAETVDKWSLYAIAQYCDQLVPTGLPGGGVEPRFTINVSIRNADDAYNVLNSIASAFRGMIYWANGTIYATQDRPSKPVKLYTKANVHQEVDDNGRVSSPAFNYSSSAKAARHNTAIVSYNNPKNLYKNDVEYVEHYDGAARYGYNPIDLIAFGCTSQGQARRLGLWTVHTENLLTQTVTFKSASEGAFLRPGDNIAISDPLKTSARWGGRILGSGLGFLANGVEAVFVHVDDVPEFYPPVATRIENSPFDPQPYASDVSPFPGYVPNDYYSLRYEGYLIPPISGTYSFAATADQGIRVYLGDRVLLEDWYQHETRTGYAYNVELIGKQRYKIIIEYYEFSGVQTTRLEWAIPGSTTWQPIPRDDLRTPDGEIGILASYYTGLFALPGDAFLQVTTEEGILEERRIIEVSKAFNRLYVSGPFTRNLPPEAVWICYRNSLKPQEFKVFSIVDKTDQQSPHYEVTALEYNESLYNAVDYGTPIEISPTTLLPPPVPSRPFNVKALINPVLKDGQWRFVLSASWDIPLLNGAADPFVARYEVQYREGTHGVWKGTITTNTTSADYDNLLEGSYFIRVRAIDILSRSSTWIESIQYLTFRPSPPPPIGSIRKTTTPNGGIIVSWDDTQTYPYGISGYLVSIDNQPFQRVPLGTFYSNEIIRSPGLYRVQIQSLDVIGQGSDTWLETVIGEEYTPRNPKGDIALNVLDDGRIQLTWSDTALYGDDWDGYIVRANNTLLERTKNTFTQAYRHPGNLNIQYVVRSVNKRGIESAGYLEIILGPLSGDHVMPSPVGEVFKTSAVDGGVLVQWTDSQQYPSHFKGYVLYVNGQLHSETAAKTSTSLVYAPGTYDVLIKAVSRSGLQSNNGLTIRLTPEDYIPPSPLYMLVEQDTKGNKQFYWGMPDNLPNDLKSFRFKYNIGSSTSWAKAHFLKDVNYQERLFETNLFREGTYTILIKAVDVNDNESINFAYVAVNLGDPIPDNVVELWNFRDQSKSDPVLTRPTWNGKLENMRVDTSTGDLVVINSELPAAFEALFSVTQEGELKVVEDIVGNYAIYYRRQTQGILWTGDDSAVLWTQEREELPMWQATEINIPFPVGVKTHIEDYIVRVQFNPSAGRIKTLNVIVDAPDIVESFNDVSINANGTRVKPKKPMRRLKAVNMSLQSVTGANTARSLRIIDKDPVQGALIEALDVNGVRTTAVVDVTIVGY